MGINKYEYRGNSPLTLDTKEQLSMIYEQLLINNKFKVQDSIKKLFVSGLWFLVYG